MNAGTVPWRHLGWIERLAVRYCRPRARRRSSVWWVAAVPVLATGCIGEPGRAIRSGGSWIPGAAVADEPPVLQNEKVPFRYPADAWAQQIQGNVTLRLHVDAGGRVVPDSTLVAVTSGVPALDSAALAAVPLLRFAPARDAGTPVAVTILFPVLFRHPAGPPLPGDSAS